MSNLPLMLSDAEIVQLRPAKNPVDPQRPYAYLVEPEYARTGRVEDVATIFLTNRECPFRCLMCDLWKNTTDATVPDGAIPAQIRRALEQPPPARHLKLYNSGNFFDPGAIPPQDYPAIAKLVADFETVIVESHPRMIGQRCWEFQELIAGELHVAMGLETAHPEILARLNKQMALDDFKRAAERLTDRGISVRAFILVRPPFMSEAEGVEWAVRSMEFAFDAGVECCALIPTRGGNGAMEYLAARGHFLPPSLAALEAAMDSGIALARGRAFVDLWDIEILEGCAHCAAARIARLRQMNLTQSAQPSIVCQACAASTQGQS